MKPSPPDKPPVLVVALLDQLVQILQLGGAGQGQGAEEEEESVEGSHRDQGEGCTAWHSGGEVY